MNFYIETNEEEPNGVAVPDNFDMTIRINKALVTNAYNNIKSRNVLKTIKSVKILKNHINDRMNFLNPDAIITTSDMGGLVTRLCNEWAVKHNRPFFIMQPSFLEVAPETRKEKISRVVVYLLFNKLLKTPIGRRQHYYGCERKTNYNLLWSNAFSNQIKDTKNVFYVGNPLFDKFSNQKVRVDIKEPVVLICTQPYTKLMDMGILTIEQAREMYRMLWEMVSQNPCVHFIIKVHPSEDMRTYSSVIFGNEIGANYSITQTASIPDLLKVADVQVSMASYTSFEAVVAGIPIIIIHPEFINFFDQFDYNISFAAKSMFEFNKYLQYSLEPQYRQAFAIDRNNYLNKKLSYFGNSAEITANTIKKVIDWKKPGFK